MNPLTWVLIAGGVGTVGYYLYEASITPALGATAPAPVLGLHPNIASMVSMHLVAAQQGLVPPPTLASVGFKTLGG